MRRRAKQIHIRLKCGAVARVSPDIQPETPEALNRLAELAMAQLGLESGTRPEEPLEEKNG